NRDVGRSTRLSRHRPPTAAQIVRRDARAAAYTLDDMADDGVGLLDCLGVERAHVVGASMGGMIAQTIAIRHPDRVLSLVSIMSNTGARWSGQPSVRLYGTLLKGAPRDRAGYVAHQMEVFEKIGSPGFPRDEDDLRRPRGTRTPLGAANRKHPAGARVRAEPTVLAERRRSRRRPDLPALRASGLAGAPAALPPMRSTFGPDEGLNGDRVAATLTKS